MKTNKNNNFLPHFLCKFSYITAVSSLKISSTQVTTNLYVDDARYASVYVRSHINRKSRREITYALSAKKISDEWIEEAFEENPLPDEREIVMRLIQKKCPASELKDRRDKVIAYLLC